LDRGSTNGTYVNGMQVRQPYDLRFGDRVTIGETTLVLRELSVSQQAPAPAAPPRRAQPRSAPRAQPSTGVTVAFWIVAAIIAGAVVCLATGAFLPWLRITGSTSDNLAPIIKDMTDIISAIMGPDSLFQVTQEIDGMEGYGKLTLGMAVICGIALAVDIFLARKSAVPGIVYLLSGLMAMGAMASDLVNMFQIYKQVEQWSILFGIQLGEVVQFLDQFVKMEVTPLVGLQLTIIGLVMLLVGGIGRLMVALLDRSKA
jgi:hypothetical protein